MGKLKYQPDLSNIKTLDDLVRYTSQAMNQVYDILQSGVEFDVNIASQTLSATFPQANTEFMVTHKLGKTGLRFLVVDKSVSCDVYHNASRDNKTQISLKCTQATTVTLILF